MLDTLAHLPPWLVLLFVFALPAAEASLFIGLVFPGETAVLVGGLLAHAGALPLWAVVVAAIAGAVIGDQVGFLVGRRYGEGFLDRLPKGMGRSRHVGAGLDLIKRRGALAVVIGRWAAALRALVPGLAGMSGMRRGPFTAANVTGGAVWAAAVAVLGYVAGASLKVVEQRLGLAGAAVAAVVVVGAVVLLVRSRGRSEAQEDGGQPGGRAA